MSDTPGGLSTSDAGGSVDDHLRAHLPGRGYSVLRQPSSEDVACAMGRLTHRRRVRRAVIGGGVMAAVVPVVIALVVWGGSRPPGTKVVDIRPADQPMVSQTDRPKVPGTPTPTRSGDSSMFSSPPSPSPTKEMSWPSPPQTAKVSSVIPTPSELVSGESDWSE